MVFAFPVMVRKYQPALPAISPLDAHPVSKGSSAKEQLRCLPVQRCQGNRKTSEKSSDSGFLISEEHETGSPEEASFLLVVHNCRGFIYRLPELVHAFFKHANRRPGFLVAFLQLILSYGKVLLAVFGFFYINEVGRTTRTDHAGE
jgi:hypothetical protein